MLMLNDVACGRDEKQSEQQLGVLTWQDEPDWVCGPASGAFLAEVGFVVLVSTLPVALAVHWDHQR
jgi:hypothetical protein